MMIRLVLEMLDVAQRCPNQPGTGHPPKRAEEKRREERKRREEKKRNLIRPYVSPRLNTIKPMTAKLRPNVTCFAWNSSAVLNTAAPACSSATLS